MLRRLSSPRKSPPAAPRHPPHRLFFAVLLALLIGTAGSTWLVFSRVPVDTIVADRYAAAITNDPAHATLYDDAYAAYHHLTGSNALHYTVHRVAEHAAAVTGHPGAAQTQAGRASEHQLPHTAWMQTLQDLWQAARHTLGTNV